MHGLYIHLLIVIKVLHISFPLKRNLRHLDGNEGVWHPGILTAQMEDQTQALRRRMRSGLPDES